MPSPLPLLLGDDMYKRGEVRGAELEIVAPSVAKVEVVGKVGRFFPNIDRTVLV